MTSKPFDLVFIRVPGEVSIKVFAKSSEERFYARCFMEDGVESYVRIDPHSGDVVRGIVPNPFQAWPVHAVPGTLPAKPAGTAWHRAALRPEFNRFVASSDGSLRAFILPSGGVMYVYIFTPQGQNHRLIATTRSFAHFQCETIAPGGNLVLVEDPPAV